MEKEQERLEKLIQEEEIERKWNQLRKIVDVFRDIKLILDFLQFKDDIKILLFRLSVLLKYLFYSLLMYYVGNDFYDEGIDVDYY